MTPKIYRTRSSSSDSTPTKFVIAEFEGGVTGTNKTMDATVREEQIRRQIAKKAADWRTKHGDVKFEGGISASAVNRIVDPAVEAAPTAKIDIAKIIGASRL